MIKRALRTFIVLALLALAGGGVWYFRADLLPQSSTAPTAFTQVVTVERGNLAATISVVGELYAPANRVLAFERLTGKTKLRTLDVAAGNKVEAGQILATIDPAPYEQAVHEARNTLETAETALTDLQKPATALAIAQADLTIAQADLAVQQAENALDELLHPDIATLLADVADAQLALTEAQATLAAQGTSSATEAEVAALRETGGETGAEYQRLAAETYTDDYYKDRLQLARNAMLDPQDTLITMDIQSQIDLLSAQSNVRKAEQTLAAAQKALQVGQAGVDELVQAQAEYAVAQAGVDLAQARADREALAAGADPIDLAAAQATVDQAQQAVDEALSDLAATTLLAPFAGTVLQTNVIAGNNITADSTILTLANLNELQVLAAVDETTIRQVTQGQAVQITFDAFPGQRFRGEVLAVPLQGELQGDVMVYQVPISLPDAQDLPLLVGMTANAAIQVGSAEDVLLVPTMAIQGGRGRQIVLVPGVSAPGSEAPAAPMPVQIESGLSDGIRTEVVSGLNEGDQVLVQMSAGTTNGNFGGGGGGILGGIPGAGGRGLRGGR